MDAKIIANYMVYIMSDAFDDLTNMKINHLLYETWREDSVIQ